MVTDAVIIIPNVPRDGNLGYYRVRLRLAGSMVLESCQWAESAFGAVAKAQRAASERMGGTFVTGVEVSGVVL